MKYSFFTIFSLLLVSCDHNPSSTIHAEELEIYNQAAVVSARKEASDIGTTILKKGGNAFDAMIATELALAVSYPFAGNISGGGFMVYRMSDGKIGSIDYREVAPSATHKDYYLDEEGNVIRGKSILGATAVGIPGTVSGLFEVHKKFGTLPIEELIQPAISLARNGIVVTERQAQSFAYYDSIFTVVNLKPLALFHQKKAGDTIVFEALANTLETIQRKGEQAFYQGELAKKMVSFLQSNGGAHTLEDFKGYQAKWRDPITFEYLGNKIISMGPPSSGGVTLKQIFGMLKSLDLMGGSPDTAAYIHKLSATFRRAYADRNEYIGDPDFVSIPTAKLTHSDYLASRIANFSEDTIVSIGDINPGKFIESDETTHYSIVDSYGNAVSVTTTLNGGYGSKLFDPELGFFYNNEMDDFSSKPGVPNMFGLVGSEANSIAPGKRMLSSMTPTIVEKDNQLLLVLGTPGGSTIITAVAQVILRSIYYNTPMQKAVDAARFHHQGVPDLLILEPNRFNSVIIDSLKRLGYTISEKTNRIIGKVNAIRITEDGKLETGADSRGDEASSGF